ncbi:vasopressin V2 receptor [Misgurnus anguillicaudatus]|uniref:vasopressin V2 receptor n=1 Tax=Misgurnus anguillicaudatus TaxID=75329 RepID=UPI003CCF6665
MGEKVWDISVHATAGLTNFTSSSFSEHTGLNSTIRDGSYFWLLSQNGSINATQSPALLGERNMDLARAEIGVLGLILALTTLGNSFVLWVLLRRRKHNAPMHLFMVNLCLADLVVGFFQVLPQLLWDITERFQGPDVLCRSVKYLQIVGMFASSFMIVAMTLDRHNAICCPLQAYKGGAVSRWNTTIIVAWGLAFLLSVPQVFIFSRSEITPGVFECWGHFAESWGLKAYVTWMTLAVFVLPTAIITVCQVRIFKEIHDNIYLKSKHMVSADMRKNMVLFHFPILKNQTRQKDTRDNLYKANNNSDFLPSNTYSPKDSHSEPDCRETSCTDSYGHKNCYSALQRNSYNNTKPSLNPSFSPCHSPSPLSGVCKAMSKTVKMTLVIVLVYTICWSPFFIVQLWAAWDPDPPDQGVAFTILMLLASLNSCTNPWIYTAFSSSVSRELLTLLRCRPKARRGSLHDHSSDIHTSIIRTTSSDPYKITKPPDS